MILRRVVMLSGLPVASVGDACDGVEALRKMHSETFGLVLCDVNMPNMDGIEFLEKVRAEEAFHSIPVVMITTEGSADRVTRALELGANGYIKKPFTAEQIHRQLVSLF